jgi:AcrR family transcriptional regulator
MTRLANNRDTPLTREEIAAEALRQFDAGSTAPSIRQLADALGATPSAIYHHFPSRAAIYQAGVELVWQEATGDVVELLGDPFEARPEDVLVTAAIASRRAFMRHYRIAPYASATPGDSETIANIVALVASVLEQLGLSPEDAVGAFHAYASFTFGGIVFAATRQIAHDELGPDDGGEPFRTTPGEREASRSSAPVRAALDGVFDLSARDPDRDEQLFADGLRRLILSFVDGGGQR